MPLDHVRPWDELDDDEKKLFARFAEVYAGFSEYTDAQVGRIIDYLEETGQLDNTIVMYCADNGASGEGSPDGTVNENKFFNAWPDDMAENLTMLDKLGSPDTYNHYPTGWATAFSTPFKMFKRYTYQGGVADPLVISWPKGIAARGETRTQYHHAVDIVPTILECIGLELPEQVQGYAQSALPGCLDEVLLRRRRTDREEDPVLRDVRHPRALARRLARGRPAGAAAGRDGCRLRQRDLGALPLRGGPRRAARPRRGAPGEGQGAGQPLVRRGRQVRRAAARQPVHGGPDQADAGRRDPRGRHLPLLPADVSGAGVRGGGDPRAGRSRSSPTSS